MLPHVLLAAGVTIRTLVASFEFCFVEALGFEASFPQVFNLLLVLNQSLLPESSLWIGQLEFTEGSPLTLFRRGQSTDLLEDLFIERQCFEQSLST